MTPSASCTALEPRRLLAASITLAGDGTMIVHGAETVANHISVYRSTVGSLQFIEAIIEVPGNPQLFTGFNVNQVARVRIDGGSATDTLDVAVTVQKPVTLNDPNASDGDLLRFSGSSGADTVSFGISGNYHLTSGATDINVGNFVERVEILGYEGNDTLRLFGDLFLPVTVAGMAGSDTINLDHVHNVYALAFGGYSTYPITLDGGGDGTDTLNVNDQAAGTSTYALPNFTGYPRLQSFDLDNGVVGADLRMLNFNAVNVNAGAGNDAFTAAVTVPGMNATFNGNEGNDSFSVGNGFNSINAPLTLNGGGGADSMALNNSTFNLDCDYDITDSAVKYGSILPLVTAVNYSGMESSSLVASPNADAIKVTDIGGPFTIDGGDGADSLAYYSTNTIYPPDRYVVTAGSVKYLRRLIPNGGVFGEVNSIFYPNVERYEIHGSPQRNNFEIQSTPATTEFYLYGDGGPNDYLQLGDATNRVNQIRSPIRFYGGTKPNSIVINNQGDTTGATLHVGEGAVGNFPDDTLFAPGGSLVFYDVATLTVNLGTGADTVYATPSFGTTITVNGGGPTPAPPMGGSPAVPAPAVVDGLYLGLADSTNTVFTPGGTGAGTYSTSDHSPISYTGMEVVSVDDVAPTVLDAAYLYDAPVPVVRIKFSEEMSTILLQPGSISLVNAQTGTIPAADIAITYDRDTNTATLTYAGGLPLPDGDYRAQFSRLIQDVYGNQVRPEDFSFDFFVLAGDANRDRSVDFNDLVVLAQNYNTTGGGTFPTGDFNYDGNVDFNDLVILAQRYNTSLPPLPPTPLNAAASKSRPVTEAKTFSVTRVSRPPQTKSPRRVASRARSMFMV